MAYLDRNDEQKQVMRIQALELRLQGHSWREVGAEVGIGHETARRWVKELLSAEEMPLRDEVRQTELARMYRWLTKLEAQIEEGNVPAINTALKVSAEIRKMLGADEPTVSVVETREVTEVDIAIRELLDAQSAKNKLRLESASDLRPVDGPSADDPIADIALGEG